MCDIKTPFITDTVGTLSLCPHQLDSVIEGVQSNTPALFFFFCSHLFALSSRSERLAGNLFVPGWLLSVLSGSPLSRNVRKARVECNLVMLG